MPATLPYPPMRPVKSRCAGSSTRHARAGAVTSPGFTSGEPGAPAGALAPSQNTSSCSRSSGRTARPSNRRREVRPTITVVPLGPDVHGRDDRGRGRRRSRAGPDEAGRGGAAHDWIGAAPDRVVPVGLRHQRLRLRCRGPGRRLGRACDRRAAPQSGAEPAGHGDERARPRPCSVGDEVRLRLPRRLSPLPAVRASLGARHGRPRPWRAWRRSGCGVCAPPCSRCPTRTCRESRRRAPGPCTPCWQWWPTSRASSARSCSRWCCSAVTTPREWPCGHCRSRSRRRRRWRCSSSRSVPRRERRARRARPPLGRGRIRARAGSRGDGCGDRRRGRPAAARRRAAAARRRQGGAGRPPLAGGRRRGSVRVAQRPRRLRRPAPAHLHRAFMAWTLLVALGVGRL